MENLSVRTSFQMTGAGQVGPLLRAGQHPLRPLSGPKGRAGQGSSLLLTTAARFGTYIARLTSHQP